VQQQGSRLVLGGLPPGDGPLARGYFVQPTVFAGVSNDWRIAREEIFGPVMVAIPWEDERDAIAMATTATTASPPTCGRETSARPSTPRTRSSPAGYRSTRGSANSQVRRTAASSRAGWAASTRSKECSTVIRSGRALPSICNGEAREAGSAVASPSLGHTPAPYVGHILSASDTTAGIDGVRVPRSCRHHSGVDPA